MTARRELVQPMSLAMPSYSPKLESELEYSLNLGAESEANTPLPDPTPDSGPLLLRAATLAAAKEKQRSAAYMRGRFKVAERARREALRDCGICEEPAVIPVRTQCCRALFCKEHIDSWLHGPASTGLCPACEAPCVLPTGSEDLTTDTAEPIRLKSYPPPASLLPSGREVLRVLSVLALLLLFGILARGGDGEEQDLDLDVFGEGSTGL
ncbi:hypothetical protein C8J57DRAFT_1333540 [Mycena rebaudengoi]|nr:hypothetical protein C8J57DRAFT_1333540 [Mycena rebaudengoi]